MQLAINQPKRSLNKAYSKEKVSRADMEVFKRELASLLDKTDATYSEDTLKDFVADFLKSTYFKDKYFVSINKERKDLAVHTGKSIKDPVGIIVEVKRLHTAEMMTAEKPNVKAFHELVLYYLHERIALGNIEIKHLIATNVHHWFFFDANEFDKKIFRNPRIKKLYDIYVQDKKDNNWFYGELKAILAAEDDTLTATHLNHQVVETVLRNASKEDDKALIAAYKILSPEHLLKKPFANDSNSLDKGFYTELLHLIGLEEVKDGGKKLIQRKAAATRSEASLLENTIIKLTDKDALHHLSNRQQWGDSTDAQLQAVALELCITWVNRILFLKLLEAQLFQYHSAHKDYLFLNSALIFDYDELANLFFQVLAEKAESRRPHLQQKFAHVPYLNSSLFERTALERASLDISALDNRQQLPLHKDTVLKDGNGKRRTGALPTLDYLFQFLDAYDFTSEGKAAIQEENKTLINASVLGLIFEKINGYKDGSFFTPGFITMYMCRETLRRAVVQKFNEAKGWNVEAYEALYDKIDNRAEANAIINSLTICDPAVGSGHFLVSALNELIAIKADLKILQDRGVKRLKEYSIEVVNDELVVTDEEGEAVDYKPGHPESQRVQEALFHEKETLIESCLFGVDINANSVKICRLRLWIELLKHAYYTKESGYKNLETLPNIDINIKQGNSLISRYALDADVTPALKQSKWTIDTYRTAVHSYKEAQTKEEKRELESLIATIKGDFRKDVSPNDPIRKKLSAKRGELAKLTQTKELFGGDEKPKKAALKVVEKLSDDIQKLEAELKEAENNKIYNDAFEWRFEFPEVLDNEGKFIGFDVVIGNPPYVTGASQKDLKNYFLANYKTAQYQLELYIFFSELSSKILKDNGIVSLITPNSWLKNLMMSEGRKFMLENFRFISINPNLSNVFDEASVDTLIFNACKSSIDNLKGIQVFDFVGQTFVQRHSINQQRFSLNEGYVFDLEVDDDKFKIMQKVRNGSIAMHELFDMTRGINPYDKYTGQTKEVIESRAYHSTDKKDETFVPELRGKHVFLHGYRWDEKHYISYGNWLAAPRELKFFQGDRILLREILGKKNFIATIITEDYKVDRSLYIAKPKSSEPQLNYVYGVLTSKLMAWFFRHEKNEFDELFPKIRVEEFKALPIKRVEHEEQVEIGNVVSQILTAKQQNSSADTTALEKQVDDLVYQLYGLTEEEIAIVEKA